MPAVTSALARALAAVAVILGLAVVLAPSAAAQTARPAIQSPFVCGQSWFARTYAGHPSFAVDWNLPGPGEADFGQPVLAGAPGVALVKQHGGYGNMVTVDHGNGWSTLYAHLSSFAVSDGQRVGARTVIGRVGNTGRSDGSHLHQEQLLNGVRQPVVLDGVGIVASGHSRGQSYTSANCAPPKREIRIGPRGACRSAVVTGWAIRCDSNGARPLP